MIWEPVKGYEGLYEVSDSGLVRSCARYINTDIRHVKSRLIYGKILKQNLKRSGYYTVDLCKDGIVKTTLVHRLVATAFCPNPHNHRFVNHIDSNRSNNDSCNLEWVSSSENRKHGIEHGNVTFYQTKNVLCVENGIVFEQAYKAASWLKSEYPDRVRGKRAWPQTTYAARAEGPNTQHTGSHGNITKVQRLSRKGVGPSGPKWETPCKRVKI